MRFGLLRGDRLSIPFQLPYVLMRVLAIAIEHAPDAAVKGGRSAVLNGVSENPRGYSDPNPEAEQPPEGFP
jgi:hypothetical protein